MFYVSCLKIICAQQPHKKKSCTYLLCQCNRVFFYFDTGNEHGRAFRDLELEAEIHKLTQNLGIGAQFGGKYFCHDVRVIRLPRHGASCPVGIGVSCSADRQVM